MSGGQAGLGRGSRGGVDAPLVQGQNVRGEGMINPPYMMNYGVSNAGSFRGGSYGYPLVQRIPSVQGAMLQRASVMYPQPMSHCLAGSYSPYQPCVPLYPRGVTSSYTPQVPLFAGYMYPPAGYTLNRPGDYVMYNRIGQPYPVPPCRP